MGGRAQGVRSAQRSSAWARTILVASFWRSGGDLVLVGLELLEVTWHYSGVPCGGRIADAGEYDDSPVSPGAIAIVR